MSHRRRSMLAARRRSATYRGGMERWSGVALVTVVLAVMVLAGSAAGAHAPRDDQPPVTIGDKDGYPEVMAKHQIGAACAPRSASVGGGLIVTLGGQEVAALTGTGVVGCGTFYGLELGAGPPKVEAPDVEPVIFFDPGQPSLPKAFALPSQGSPLSTPAKATIGPAPFSAQGDGDGWRSASRSARRSPVTVSGDRRAAGAMSGHTAGHANIETRRHGDGSDGSQESRFA